MSSTEVIVIEDTPPSSPVQIIKRTYQVSRPSNVPRKDMYYQPLNNEFPVAERAMIWSKNTTNFIKQSMNSVQQNRLPIFNNNLQNKPFQMAHVQNRPLLPRNGNQFNGIRSFPRPPYNLYNFNHYHEANRVVNQKIFSNNFWMKVKLEELPDKGEVVSQYYIDDNQTPIRVFHSEPEFIDINTFANKMKIQDKKIPVPQTNEQSLNLSAETDDLKRKNSVPLFLKRSRPVNLTMKPLEEHTNNTPSPASNNQKDSDDIIFIGKFKNSEVNAPKPEIKEACIKITPVDYKNVSSTVVSKELRVNVNKTYLKSPKYGKSRRRNKTLMPTRRNPKRQVQKEKEFLKMIDNVIMESEKEERQKKNGYCKNKPGRTAIKQIKRSPRICATTGAVYSPPSPLTNAHIRDWPAEGMHERPEYDPVSGKILPFDSNILKISKEYTQNNSGQNNPVTNTDLMIENLENDKTFPELCHEMLHHVLSYIATVKMLEKEDNKKESNRKKIEFLEILDLQNSDVKIENKICNILHSIIEEITKCEDSPTENLPTPLMDLLKNSILLYCLTNNVDTYDVAKYIASVQPEDIIKLSNEQFNLLSIPGN